MQRRRAARLARTHGRTRAGPPGEDAAAALVGTGLSGAGEEEAAAVVALLWTTARACLRRRRRVAAAALLG